MKKLFTLLTMLLVGIGSMWGQTQNITVLNNDPCLGALTDNNQQYLYKSSPITGSTGNTALATIRLTFKSTYKSYLENNYGYPCVHFAEFYLYDKDGNSVDLTQYTATSIFSSNATSTDEGSINCLNDGTTSGASNKYDWYWHSAWRNGPNAYHYLEINAAAIDADLSTFQIGYITRNTECVPSNIEVTTTVYTPSEIINEVNANADYIAASDKQMNVVGLKPYSVTSALKEAVTAQTPDAKNILIAFEAFKAANKITLVQGNVYRFVSASRAKPGYVVSANSDNNLIWEAEDEKDYNQLWKLTWKGSDSHGTILNVGTNLYPQGKGSGGGQFSLGGTATNTYISHLGSGQYNIKPQNNGSMHVGDWNDSEKTSGKVISWNNTTIGDPSAWYIYEVEVYTISITGGGGEGRIVINGTEYANGAKFYKVNWDDFTPVAKTITGYISGEIVVSGNTISVEYTGYNGIINGMTTISANAWKTEENWDYLTDNWDSHGPGCLSSNMWSPIYLKDITAGTVPALEGWNFRMIADHSKYTIESLGKIQGGQSCYFTLKNTSDVTINFDSGGHTYPLTVNLDEGTGNILTFNMSNGYNHACQTDCNGKITVNYGSVSKDTNRLFKAKNTGSKHVNTLILNAALTTPTEYNTLETITLATFDNVSCHTLTTNILDNEGWTESTSMDDLQHPSVAGKYYFVQKISSGVTLYTYMPKTYDVTGVETLSEIVDYKTYTIFNIPDGSTLILDEELEENQVINAEAITSVIQINDGITLNIDNITNTQFPTITGEGTLNINMSESEVMAKLNGNASCTLVDVLSDDQIAVGALKINDAEKYTIDGYDYYISQDGTTKDVVLIKHYTRNVTSGRFGSICIENAALVSQMTGIEKVLKVTSVETDRVVMDEVEEMTAGVPYIFKSNDAAINLTLKGETVDGPDNTTQGYLVGNFVPTAVPESTNEQMNYVLQSNQFRKVTTSTITSGRNRCYLKVTVDPSRQSTLGIAVDEGGATGIDAINSLMNNNAEIYDLNGRKLNDLRKGINIVNGVKVIVK